MMTRPSVACLGERAGEMNGALTVFRIIHVQLRPGFGGDSL